MAKSFSKESSALSPPNHNAIIKEGRLILVTAGPEVVPKPSTKKEEGGGGESSMAESAELTFGETAFFFAYGVWWMLGRIFFRHFDLLAYHQGITLVKQRRQLT